MSSKIANFKEEDGVLTFTIGSTDVSFVNAIRRTILSDIPVVVFKTAPDNENRANILVNTSRLHNEIIKQRLGCIPIHISEPGLIENLQNYQLELDVENKTDTMMIVTTKDFKIKNLSTDQFLAEDVVRRIFPPFIPPTGKGEYFIDFVRLRPKVSEDLPGEKIKLTCAFSVSTARDNSMYNITGTCSYGCTPDQSKIAEQLEIRKQKWKDEGKSADEIKFEGQNWVLLEGLRYVVPKSFDFIIQSVGIYENTEIIIKACLILNDKFTKLSQELDQDEVPIEPSVNTLENSYDVTLINEDYTVGNILNYQIYTIFYSDLKIVDYVGFKKMHPHDSDSILRIALTEKGDGKNGIKKILKLSIEESIKKINSIKGLFDGSRK